MELAIDEGLNRVSGRVKWFDPAKGFGFVVSEDGGPDILLHANVLRNFGQSSVADGVSIEITVQATSKGVQATEVIDIGHFLSQADYDWASAMSGEKKAQSSVLLFESNPFFRNMLAPLLQASGYRVTSVATMDEALAADIDPTKYDVVLADIDNNGEADRFLAQLSSDDKWRDVPRIALSNREDKTIASDFAGCVRKSDRHGLLAVIDQTASLKGRAA